MIALTAVAVALVAACGGKSQSGGPRGGGGTAAD
jgi:hypothetical protein